MPSEPAAAALRDMAHHIDLAVQFVSDFDQERFAGDVRTVYAVTRCLEIISEASRRLPAELKDRHPGIAWKNIAGAGNIYRHEYEDVAVPQIWNTVHFDLPRLRAVVLEELSALR